MRATQEQTKIAILTLVTIFLLTNRLDAIVINVPADQPTIQAGIDAAVEGDTVLVAPGTYTEIIDFSGKAITVRSSAGAATTIIDATGVPDPGDGLPVVRFDNGEGLDSVLEGFTLTGGTGDSRISEGGPTYGGGVVINMSAATLRGCVIEGNTAEIWGGGILVYQGELVLEDCTLRMNHAENDGGAIYMIETTGLTIDGCVFSGNTSTIGTAGIEFNTTTGSVVITGSLFEGHISDNASFGSALAAGGNDGPVTIDRCVFRDNAIAGGSGGAVFLNNLDVNRVTNSLFVGNSASANGGAMNFNGTAGSFIAGCVFANNSAGNQGGAVNHRTNDPIFNCSFSGNTASNGSAVRFFAGDTLFANCVFWDGTGSSPIVAVAGAGTLTINNSIVEGGWTGVGSRNLDMDPMYVDPINEDLTLMAGSPAIDSGNTPDAASVLSPTDISGAARLTDDPMTADTGVPLFGQTIDMGAYEYGSTAPALIEQQPSSLIGTPSTLSIFVVTAPDATSFQWFFNGSPISDGGAYNGTSTNVLFVHIGNETTEGLYSVEVSDGVRTETSVETGLVVLADPTGACCLSMGDCMVGSEADCIAVGGTYAGDDTDCASAECPAVCLGDMNGDGAIDGLDSQLFIDALLSGAVCN